MKKTKLMTSVTSTFYKAKFQLVKHSPELFIAAGVVSTAAGIVMACKATLKVNDVMDEAKTTIDKIHTATETGRTVSGEEYTSDDAKKELAIVYTQTGVKLIKLYAPAVFFSVAGIGCMLTSHNILHKRNAALAAAYATIDKGFKEYRGRVAERFGKEVDKELKHNLKTQEIETTVIDERGKEKKVKETVTVVGNDEPSEYARFFDDGCTGWEKNAEYNLMFLRGQQQWANDLLITRKYVFLNEIYKALGIPETEAGQVVGWIYDPENPAIDSYIDFGLYNLHKEKTRDFVNGRERTILLDFNPDGYILDKAFAMR